MPSAFAVIKAFRWFSTTAMFASALSGIEDKGCTKVSSTGGQGGGVVHALKSMAARPIERVVRVVIWWRFWCLDQRWCGRSAWHLVEIPVLRNWPGQEAG
jgi:hypothetical protein